MYGRIVLDGVYLCVHDTATHITACWLIDCMLLNAPTVIDGMPLALENCTNLFFYTDAIKTETVVKYEYLVSPHEGVCFSFKQ